MRYSLVIVACLATVAFGRVLEDSTGTLIPLEPDVEEDQETTTVFLDEEATEEEEEALVEAFEDAEIEEEEFEEEEEEEEEEEDTGNVETEEEDEEEEEENEPDEIPEDEIAENEEEVEEDEGAIEESEPEDEPDEEDEEEENPVDEAEDLEDEEEESPVDEAEGLEDEEEENEPPVDEDEGEIENEEDEIEEEYGIEEGEDEEEEELEEALKIFTSTLPPEDFEEDIEEAPAPTFSFTPYPTPYRPPTLRPATPYVSSDDDPLKEEDNDYEGDSGDFFTKQSTIDEMEHDRNVIIALSVVFGVMFFFSIFVAYSMLENPDGCCASICRIMVACWCGLLRCICYPCRAMCGCTGPSHGNHMIVPDDGRFTHDLELS